MKKKVQQKTMAQLFQDINSMMEELENGGSLKQLEKLQKHTQELHNRATILQYKAAEKLVKEDDDQVDVSNELKNEDLSTKKKEPKKPTNQESLFSFQLDEVETTEPTPEEEPMAFSPISETTVEEEPVIAVPEPTPSEPEPIHETPTSSVKPAQAKEDESFSFGNAKPIEEQVLTLADKLSAKKIESINGIMSVQEKMQFTNDLFDGDHVQFADAITRLDKAPDADQAKHLLSNLSRNFGWDLENKVTQHFIQLVERKFKA